MIIQITDPLDPRLEYVRDDPVRPDIPIEFRVGHNRFVCAYCVDDRIHAVVCVNLLDKIPTSVEELGESDNYTTAVFYTIWGYVPGAATKLLSGAVSLIRERYPTVRRFVTLSPKTEMARRFHLRNGAVVLSDNETTVNYEYTTF